MMQAGSLLSSLSVFPHWKSGSASWRRPWSVEENELRDRISHADPASFQKALADETARRVDDFLAGIKAYRAHPYRRALEPMPEIWRRGNGYVGVAAKNATRIPPGHPEGYLEAFGNIYREAFRAIAAEVAGKRLPRDLDFPTIADGVEGMQFIETAVRSAKLGARWVKFPQ